MMVQEDERLGRRDIRTLYNRVQILEHTTNLTCSTLVCMSMIRTCSASDKSGIPYSLIGPK